jgi:hypothetical protein
LPASSGPSTSIETNAGCAAEGLRKVAERRAEAANYVAAGERDLAAGDREEARREFGMPCSQAR